MCRLVAHRDPFSSQKPHLENSTLEEEGLSHDPFLEAWHLTTAPRRWESKKIIETYGSNGLYDMDSAHDHP